MIINLTPYSIFTVTLTINIFILFFIFITNFKTIVLKIPLRLTSIILLTISIRLLLPFEFEFTNPIPSFNILPKVDNILKKTMININSNKTLNTLSLVYFIWLIIAIILVVNYFYKYFLLYKKTSKIPNTNNKNVLNILNKIKKQYNFNFTPKIITNKNVKFPSEFGYFNQIIFINDIDYNEDEIYYILLHEMLHFYSKTNIIITFIKILNLVFWWNPINYLLTKHIENIMEIYVDQYVTKSLNYKEKVIYMKCIFKAYKLTNNNIINNSLINPIGSNFSNNITFKRIKIIDICNSKKNNNKFICILLLIIFLGFLNLSIKYVIQPAWNPPEQDLKEITNEDLKENNSYIIKENGKYIMYYNNDPLISSETLNDLPNVPYIER